MSQGCIKPLCDLLVCPDPRIVTVCLEGLENILKVGEAEKTLGNSTGDVNYYAQLIDDADVGVHTHVALSATRGKGSPSSLQFSSHVLSWFSGNF